MILSRFAEHLKHQHWTAVFLDFLIVVLGVFIGTNVTNWNDAHKMRVRSEHYTQRLLDDLYVEYQHDISLLDYDTDAQKAAMTAFAGLARRSKLDDRTILINAFRASQYQWYEQHRATYDELLSSGELDLIADTHLRETAIRYYGNSQTTFNLVLDHEADSSYRKLFFQLVDPDVEIALRKDCGDRDYTTDGGVSGVYTIGYECRLSVDDAAVKRTVDALRHEPRILPTLRQQSSVYDLEIFNINYLLNESGIKGLFGKEGRH